MSRCGYRTPVLDGRTKSFLRRSVEKIVKDENRNERYQKGQRNIENMRFTGLRWENAPDKQNEERVYADSKPEPALNPERSKFKFRERGLRRIRNRPTQDPFRTYFSSNGRRSFKEI